MKIISRNAQGKFREKFPEIRKLSGDVYIIQECENPLHSHNMEYREFATGGNSLDNEQTLTRDELLAVFRTLGKV